MQFFKIETEIINICGEKEKIKKPKPPAQNINEEEMLAALTSGLPGYSRSSSSNDTHEQRKLMQTKITLFLEEHSKDCLIRICSITENELIMLGASTRGADCVINLVPVLLKNIGIEYKDCKIEEVTLQGAKSLSELSKYNGFSGHATDFFEHFKIESLVNGYYSENGIVRKEAMLETDIGKKDLLKKAEQLLCCGSLVPEIERIFTPAKYNAPGHPVHYIIQTDNDEVGDEIAGILLSALYKNGRLQSRRYCTVGVKGVTHWGGSQDEVYEALYKSCENGAISVRIIDDMPEEDDTMNAEASKIEYTCRIAMNNRNKALTIFQLPRAAERVKAVMREHLGTMTLVEITEDNVSAQIAKAFLRQSARENKVKADKALYKDISDAFKTYSISELHEAFRIWYDNQLKTKCYTQYADIEAAGRLAVKKGKPRGDAHKELDKMIGLEEAKKVICQAVDYFKVQKLFKDRGISDNRPTMHMVFGGSPGTAKTTVARLFAQIMKDNGLLSVGGMVEVGRADLVGKYVGWTAKTVESKFREAKGSVLFIDEAYSLIDDKGNSFGDEAINTIVQEMENRREDVVVIFAGYTDRMNDFLEINPGLRSRIAFHVPFADYSADELLQILELMAEKQSMKLGDGVNEKLIPILETASKDPDFGNGRYMRNLLEKARMKQSSRILAKDIEKVTNDELTTLIADDFETPAKLSNEIRKMGFCA